MTRIDQVDGAAPLLRATLIRSSITVGAITAGPLIITIVSAFIRLSSELQYLVAPAALLGIVSPVIGFRLYLALKRRLPADAGLGQRCQHFYTATIIPLAVTETVALFGVIAFMLSGAPACLIGVLTHVILAAAIWPTQERLEQFMA
jgi:hypothetical protein